MAEKKGTFWFNSKSFVALRVVVYVIIIVCLYFWGRRGRRPASAERPPEATSTRKSSDQEAGPEKPYPSVTLYGWCVRPAGEGQQQIDVLVKFGQYSEEIEFSDLKLRAKGSPENLASAENSGDVGRAQLGLGRLTFFIPEGQPEFRVGSVFCWVEDLCVLNGDQRLAPAEFDRWAEEMKGEAAETPPEKPDSAKPDAPPPVTAPQGIQVPA